MPAAAPAIPRTFCQVCALPICAAPCRSATCDISCPRTPADLPFVLGRGDQAGVDVHRTAGQGERVDRFVVDELEVVRDTRWLQESSRARWPIWFSQRSISGLLTTSISARPARRLPCRAGSPGLGSARSSELSPPSAELASFLRHVPPESAEVRVLTRCGARVLLSFMPV